MKTKKTKWRGIIVGLIIFLILTVIVATSLGAVKIPFLKVIQILFKLGEKLGVSQTIIWKIRLPRVLLAGLVGLALATSGTVFQALLKNPMADPYVIGISSGASLGATLGMLWDFQFSLLGLNSIPIFAFSGALVTTFIVYNLAKVGHKISVSTLLLAGVAVGSFLSAIVSLLMVFNNQSMQRIVFWMMGSLAVADWAKVEMIWIYIIIGYFSIHVFARDLNIMLLGAEAAQGLGVEAEQIKKILLIVGSLLAGVAVAGSGVIGFVGLIIPHLVRLLVGPDHRILIPSSALVGAIFLILTDTLARTVIAPTEIPVGIITSLFGGPFFLYLLSKKKTTGF
ncbi:ABC-type Fe3+-siderophore transport system, permease component [Halobacteroides halobius DSM 5150]|uniref:ABC-type Fe3+-siderophore transport system, permease component n=1 Tax=Halobacteroides halobius (strain ATCC 35273 / DSM 5150 / MD-1) TaxID=748449 RepID=L0KC33_HALHC|nr:iron chelate uptake ABC transporter family permease subunit [Halobacteroides halobius]AGB41648.1 ABC-type Fe3+-siderophore transport system, permease component [Halobacteroides halobius DSM 5150]